VLGIQILLDAGILAVTYGQLEMIVIVAGSPVIQM